MFVPYTADIKGVAYTKLDIQTGLIENGGEFHAPLLYKGGLYMNVDMKIAMERLQEMDSLPAVLKPSDVAKVLGVSRNTAYETVHSTGFPSFKVGKQYRVRLDRFFQWMIEEAKEKAERAKQAA